MYNISSTTKLHLKIQKITLNIQKVKTYFFLFLGVDGGGAWGRMAAAASLRGLPRGRLSAWAGLPVDVAPTLLEGGEGPWSEGSTVLSSDDILERNDKKIKDGLGLLGVAWQVRLEN